MYKYNFAVASAQSAGKWHEFSEHADRYYLQYRTAKDERVREEHAILDGITLPMDDPFWDEFFPPNGWNCRCEAIQVSKKRYEPSNSSEALARGRSATYKPNADGVNKAAIFRFNPGKEQRIFPKKHPYFPKGCGDCGLNQYAVGKGKPQCTVCSILAQKKKEYRIKIKDYISNNLQGKITYSNKFLPEVAKINKNLKKEITAHKGSIVQLIKSYDTLSHIDRYLDPNATLFKEKIIHKNNGNATDMYVLQSKYKGDLSFRKGEIVQILFRREKKKNNHIIIFYYLRDWNNEREYLDWKKQTGR